MKMKTSLLPLLLCLSLLKMVLARPVMQSIIINQHEWQVPNEPGWEEVIQDAEDVQQQIFNSCQTPMECSRIVDAMRMVFLKYPVSRKYLDGHSNDADDLLASIFKWGWWHWNTDDILSWPSSPSCPIETTEVKVIVFACVFLTVEFSLLT